MHGEMQSSSEQHSYMRDRIITKLLENVARENPSNDHLIDGVTLAHTLSTLYDASSSLPAGITAADITRFVPSFTGLDVDAQESLLKKMDSWMVSIADYFHCDDDANEEERRSRAKTLPQTLAEATTQLSDDESAILLAYGRITELATKINIVHPLLRNKLISAVETLPPIINASRAAQNDLATTLIETGLAHLALIRAKAYNSLYGYENMTDALSAAYDKLDTDAKRMQAEQDVLDQQLIEYEQLLSLVDGGKEEGSGFSQIVQDFIQVQTETEQCRSDLRRLGWTGH